MILFLIQAIFYTTMTLVIFNGNGNKSLYALVIFTFIINQIAFILYGIDTNQLGFILSVIFQMFLLLLTLLFITAMPILNINEDEELDRLDEYEDQ